LAGCETIIGNHNTLYRTMTFPLTLSERSFQYYSYFMCAADMRCYSDS